MGKKGGRIGRSRSKGTKFQLEEQVLGANGQRGDTRLCFAL